jgi:hypothetical protein
VARARQLRKQNIGDFHKVDVGEGDQGVMEEPQVISFIISSTLTV